MTNFIAVLSLLNGVFSIIRCHEFFDIFDEDDADVLFIMSYELESICFFGVIWLFGIRFYETVYNLETVI